MLAQDAVDSEDEAAYEQDVVRVCPHLVLLLRHILTVCMRRR